MAARLVLAASCASVSREGKRQTWDKGCVSVPVRPVETATPAQGGRGSPGRRQVGGCEQVTALGVLQWPLAGVEDAGPQAAGRLPSRGRAWRQPWARRVGVARLGLWLGALQGWVCGSVPGDGRLRLAWCVFLSTLLS